MSITSCPAAWHAWGKLGQDVSQPDQEAPEGFREFLESAARQGDEHIPSFIQADLQSEKISLNPTDEP